MALQELPLYQQIYDDLKAAINDGVYRQEEKIPTETELSKAYAVSRVTVRRAIEDLSIEGYLVKRRGLGTFVCAPRMRRSVLRGGLPMSFTEICQANGHKASSKLIKQEVVPPHGDEQEFFGIGKDDLLLRVQRVRLADDLPIFEENMLLSYKDTKELVSMDLSSVSLYQLLDDLYGRKPREQRRVLVRAMGASSTRASALQISVGEPLLYTTTYAVDQYEKPIYIGRQYYVGSRYMLDL